MTTLTHTHTPNIAAVSQVSRMYDLAEYTFCETCENNIERFYIDDDYDRLPYWSGWMTSR